MVQIENVVDPIINLNLLDEILRDVVLNDLKKFEVHLGKLIQLAHTGVYGNILCKKAKESK